jgi:hypothetical protein
MKMKDSRKSPLSNLPEVRAMATEILQYFKAKSEALKDISFDDAISCDTFEDSMLSASCEERELSEKTEKLIRFLDSLR